MKITDVTGLIVTGYPRGRSTPGRGREAKINIAHFFPVIISSAHYIYPRIKYPADKIPSIIPITSNALIYGNYGYPSCAVNLAYVCSRSEGSRKIAHLSLLNSVSCPSQYTFFGAGVTGNFVAQKFCRKNSMRHILFNKRIIFVWGYKLKNVKTCYVILFPLLSIIIDNKAELFLG